MKTITGRISDYYHGQARFAPHNPNKAKDEIEEYAYANDLTIDYQVEWDSDGRISDSECYGEVTQYQPDGEAWIDYVPLSEHRCEYRIHNANYSGKPQYFWHDPEWTGQERMRYANHLGMSKGNAYLAAKDSMLKSAETYVSLTFYGATMTITDDDSGEEVYSDSLWGIDDEEYAAVVLFVDGNDPLAAMKDWVAEKEELTLTTYA